MLASQDFRLLIWFRFVNITIFQHKIIAVSTPHIDRWAMPNVHSLYTCISGLERRLRPLERTTTCRNSATNRLSDVTRIHAVQSSYLHGYRRPQYVIGTRASLRLSKHTNVTPGLRYSLFHSFSLTSAGYSFLFLFAPHGLKCLRCDFESKESRPACWINWCTLFKQLIGALYSEDNYWYWFVAVYQMSMSELPWSPRLAIWQQRGIRFRAVISISVIVFRFFLVKSKQWYWRRLDKLSDHKNIPVIKKMYPIQAMFSRFLQSSFVLWVISDFRRTNMITEQILRYRK